MRAASSEIGDGSTGHRIPGLTIGPVAVRTSIPVQPSAHWRTNITELTEIAAVVRAAPNSRGPSRQSCCSSRYRFMGFAEAAPPPNDPSGGSGNLGLVRDRDVFGT